MNTNPRKSSPTLRLVTVLSGLALLVSCATQPVGRPEDVAAAKSLKEARSMNLSLEARAADYLRAASLSASNLGTGPQPTVARQNYNAAAAEVTILLRSGEGGRLWNHP